MIRYLPALLLAFLPAPALAQPAPAVTSIVRTADLDLSSRNGQRALDQRLTIAIANACGEASPIDLVGQNLVRACKVEARGQVRIERDRIIAERDRSLRTQVAAR